jgi:hypothetical protein
MNIVRKKFALQKLSMLVLILMISSVCLVASTDAHAPGFEIYSPWASSPPTIDGTISAEEWDNAWTADIADTGIMSNVTLYVMNDARYLYIAVDDENDTTCLPDSGAQLGIYFDDEPAGAHDGAWTYTECPSGEGNFWLNPGTSPPQFSGIIQGVVRCTVVSPVSGVSKEFTNSSGHLQYEVAIDLEESPLKADTLKGDTFGFRIYVYNQDVDKFDGYWPLGASWSDPSTYGDLTLSGLHERLDALLTDIETLKNDIEEVSGTIADMLEETLDSIESDIDAINTKIASINETLGTMESDVETIKEQTTLGAFNWTIITMIFALIAAIGSIASVILSRKRT